MVRTGSAEWMLARRFGVERANEIAGDLLEQYKPARVSWEMLRIALAIRGVELAGLLLVSLSIVMIQSALYSAWPLHYMLDLRTLHLNWTWNMFTLLGFTSFAAWLVTASSALRLGIRHSITRSSLSFSVTLSILSCFMLQPELCRISPVILAVVILWRLRTSGAAATLSCIVAVGVVMGSLYLFLPSVRLWELRRLRDAHAHTRLTASMVHLLLSLYSVGDTSMVHVVCQRSHGLLAGHFPSFPSRNSRYLRKLIFRGPASSVARRMNSPLFRLQVSARLALGPVPIIGLRSLRPLSPKQADAWGRR